jgi:Pyruvate formate lyase.
MKKEYIEMLNNVRKAKLIQTQDKLDWEGYLDEDDYGRIVPTFEWHIIPNSTDGNFYGAEGWSENFYNLMSCHDIYDDPNDAFSGRWMYFMSKMRPSNFPERLILDSMKRDIDFYGLDAGIGLDAHFCPDYRIGLALGWGGLIEKTIKYEAENASTKEEHSFYACHRKVIEGVQLWMQRHIDYLEKKYLETGADVYRIKAETNRAILLSLRKHTGRLCSG